MMLVQWNYSCLKIREESLKDHGNDHQGNINKHGAFLLLELHLGIVKCESNNRACDYYSQNPSFNINYEPALEQGHNCAHNRHCHDLAGSIHGCNMEVNRDYYMKVDNHRKGTSCHTPYTFCQRDFDPFFLRYSQSLQHCTNHPSDSASDYDNS